MSRRIAIVGAGGHGREILQLIRDINAALAPAAPTWDCAGFLVDAGFDAPPTIAGLPVLGDLAWLAANPDAAVVVAVGAPAARKRLVRRIRALGSTPCVKAFPVLVHPRAWIGAGVELGAGSVVCAGAMLTTDIRLGEHVHVNVGCTLAHDDVLEDFVTLAPGVHLAGNVLLGEGVELGIGSTVIPRARVGAWSVVGAGAVVTANIDADCTAVGAPARPIKRRTAGWHES
ncbi:MAG: acetyltransferase [Lysobacteraceae bacterium]|nr:MAG: acetyltransferase [Xanthomonadaceae bacterium]